MRKTVRTPTLCLNLREWAVVAPIFVQRGRRAAARERLSPNPRKESERQRQIIMFKHINLADRCCRGDRGGRYRGDETSHKEAVAFQNDIRDGNSC